MQLSLNLLRDKFSGECVYSKMYAYRHAETAHIPHEYVGLTQACPNNNVIQEAYPCNSREEAGPTIWKQNHYMIAVI